jgi:hypothetical protein
VLHTTAFRFCRLLAGNDSAAEEMAQDAFTRTWQEIEAEADKIDWQGQESFVSYVRNLLIFRCRDQARSYWRRSQRSVALDPSADGDEGAGGSLIDVLADRSTRPGASLSLFVRDTFRFVAALREICGKKAELATLLASLEEYLRIRLLRSAPASVDRQSSIEDLIDAAAPDTLEIEQADMYDYFERSLGINRNTVYLRMKRIRELANQHLGAYL